MKLPWHLSIVLSLSVFPPDSLIEGKIDDYEKSFNQRLLNLPTSIEALDLYASSYGEDLTILKRFKNLKRLEIGGAEGHLSSEELGVIGSLPLESLYVRVDNVPTESLALNLSRMKKLKNLVLILYNNHISTKQLSKTTSLKGLYITAQLTGSLADLSTCSKLKYLRLSPFTPELEEKKDDALFKGISKLTELESLCIRECDISKNTLEEISRLPNLKCLDLGNVDDGDLSIVAKMTSLEKLNLSNSKITDKGVSCLASLKNLRALKLSDTAITDDPLKAFSGLSNLEELNLLGTRTNGSGLKYLTGLTKLRSLVLGAVNNTNLEPISKMQSLENLDLNAATINETGAGFIALAPRLRALRIGKLADEKASRELEKFDKNSGASLISDNHDIHSWSCF